MKAPGVKTSNLRNWVEMNDQMGMLFGDMTPFLNLPAGLANGEYRWVEMHGLGECAAYNKCHGFEETHVYCHVFYLGDTLYKEIYPLCEAGQFLLEGRMYLLPRIGSAAAHGRGAPGTDVRSLLSGRKSSIRPVLIFIRCSIYYKNNSAQINRKFRQISTKSPITSEKEREAAAVKGPAPLQTVSVKLLSSLLLLHRSFQCFLQFPDLFILLLNQVILLV